MQKFTKISGSKLYKIFLNVILSLLKFLKEIFFIFFDLFSNELRNMMQVVPWNPRPIFYF